MQCSLRPAYTNALFQLQHVAALCSYLCLYYCFYNSLYFLPFFIFFTFPSTITLTVRHTLHALKLFWRAHAVSTGTAFLVIIIIITRIPKTHARTHTHTVGQTHTHTHTHALGQTHRHGGTQALACFCRVYCGLR